MERAIRILVYVCLALLVASAAQAQCDPKSTYIRVWNLNGTDYPTGTTGDNGLTFSCFLKDANNAWAASNTFTHSDQGFDYFVSGGTYPNHTVHDISIQCGNFAPFCWEAGDSLIVVAEDVDAPFSGETSRYGMVLDSSPEQYAIEDFTLPVFITSFDATPGPARVVLSWETASEADNLGFHLYRSEDELTGYVRITEQLVESAGSSAFGSTYTYLDLDLTDGTYWYKLEDLGLDGTAREYGPISTIVGLAAGLAPSTWGKAKRVFGP